MLPTMPLAVPWPCLIPVARPRLPWAGEGGRALTQTSPERALGCLDWQKCSLRHRTDKAKRHSLEVNTTRVTWIEPQRPPCVGRECQQGEPGGGAEQRAGRLARLTPPARQVSGQQLPEHLPLVPEGIALGRLIHMQPAVCFLSLSLPPDENALVQVFLGSQLSSLWLALLLGVAEEAKILAKRTGGRSAPCLAA